MGVAVHSVLADEISCDVHALSAAAILIDLAWWQVDHEAHRQGVLLRMTGAIASHYVPRRLCLGAVAVSPFPVDGMGSPRATF